MAKDLLGGNAIPTEGQEKPADIMQNRTLIVQKLTSLASPAPEVVRGLRTLDEVFSQFQPEQDVVFKDADGSEMEETLQFKNIGDFGAKGITNQSRFLGTLNSRKLEYDKFYKTLKSNAVLKKVLENPEAKASYLAALAALIKEIEDSSK